MERTLDLHYDKIVIGADLSALSFCYSQKIPFIFIRRIKPYPYGFDLDWQDNLKIYEHMFYMLAISGYSPLFDKVQSIRLDENNLLKVTTKTNSLIRIKYNELIISDDYKIEGLPNIVGKTNYYNCVIDYMGIADTYIVKTMGDTGLNSPQAVYYPGTYVSGTKVYKNLIVNSLLTDEQLYSEEYSESYMRFRIFRIYKNMQLLKHFRREIYPMGKNLYELPEGVRVLTDSNNFTIKTDNYLNFIESKLWSKL